MPVAMADEARCPSIKVPATLPTDSLTDLAIAKARLALTQNEKAGSLKTV